MPAITHGDPQLVPNSSSVRTGGEDMLNYFENPRAALLVRVLRFTDVSVEHAGMSIAHDEEASRKSEFCREVWYSKIE